jgi:dTMP kinase
MFVAIEGIEGSGKSTLLAALAQRLRSDGVGVVVTREPGGTTLGDAVRELFLNRSLTIEPLAEALLVNAARAQHVAEVIRPALRAGRILLCDRFTDSTLAYQGYGRGIDLELLRRLCETATGGVAPDLTLLVDLPVAAIRARLRGRHRGTDRIEREDDGFHERVRQGFLKLSDSPDHRILNGDQPEERLADIALREIRERFGVRVR